MNLAEISPEVIVARGEYATVNGEYKTLMSTMQAWAQQACDALRHGLNEPDVEAAQKLFGDAELISSRLKESVLGMAELKAQKDAIYQTAWGK